MADKQTSALSLISSDREFFDSEQRIVDYILSHQESASGMTLAELARVSETSEASVSRFCKRLGFKNYRAFQFSLAYDLSLLAGHQDITGKVSFDDVAGSVNNIVAAKVSELSATARGLDPTTLKATVTLLERANIIQIVAVGNTLSVANDANFKFSQLGLRCVSNTISETSVAFSLTLTPQDLLLVISNSGKSRRLDTMMRAAHEAGCPIVLITSDPKAPLVRWADHLLITVNHEALLTTGDFTFSKMSAILIIEILYHLLFHRISGAGEHISDYEELIAPDKDMTS